MLQFWIIFIPKQTAENNHNCSYVYECHKSAWKQHSLDIFKKKHIY